MARISPELVNAFYRTKYCVIWEDGQVSEILLNQPLPDAVTQWFAKQYADSYAIITADNPGAVLQNPVQNQTARVQLEAMLNQAGFAYRPTQHIAMDGNWPNEKGYLIADIGPKQAITLGQSFGQVAIIFGTTRDAMPKLEFIQTE